MTESAQMTGTVDQAYFAADFGTGLKIKSSSLSYERLLQVEAAFEHHARLQPDDNGATPPMALSYVVLGDRTAAVIRRWETGVTQGRNESHMLLGDPQVLTAERALVLDQWQWLTRKPTSDQLPPLGIDRLPDPRAWTDHLPAEAEELRSELTQTLAKLIDDPHRPVSILRCPEPDKVKLVRTLRAIWTGAADAAELPARRWTFSTYETEHADSIPGMPAIVFLPGWPEGVSPAARIRVELGAREHISGHAQLAHDIVDAFIARQPPPPRTPAPPVGRSTRVDDPRAGEPRPADLRAGGYRGDDHRVDDLRTDDLVASPGIGLLDPRANVPSQDTHLQPSVQYSPPEAPRGGPGPGDYARPARTRGGTAAPAPVYGQLPPAADGPLAPLLTAGSLTGVEAALERAEAAITAKRLTRMDIMQALDAGAVDRIVDVVDHRRRQLFARLVHVAFGPDLAQLREHEGTTKAAELIERSGSEEFVRCLAQLARPIQRPHIDGALAARALSSEDRNLAEAQGRVHRWTRKATADRTRLRIAVGVGTVVLLALFFLLGLLVARAGATTQDAAAGSTTVTSVAAAPSATTEQTTGPVSTTADGATTDTVTVQATPAAGQTVYYALRDPATGQYFPQRECVESRKGSHTWRCTRLAAFADGTRSSLVDTFYLVTTQEAQQLAASADAGTSLPALPGSQVG